MSKITYCRSCARSIVWLLTNNQKRMPVDSGAVSADDVYYDPQRHASHFATCPDRDKWRKKKASNEAATK